MQFLTTCRREKTQPNAQSVSEQRSHLLAGFPSYIRSMTLCGRERPFGQSGSAVLAVLSQLLVHLAGCEKLKSPWLSVGTATTQQQLKPSVCYQHYSHAKSKTQHYTSY